MRDIDICVPDELISDEYVICYDFEAIQVPIEDTFLGRSIHYEHVPATVSIASNIPGHKDPVYLVSTGDPQELTDRFVNALILIQQEKERLMDERYALYTKELEDRLKTLSEELGLDDNKEKTGTKRKRNNTKRQW